ncbi:MAG: hypothetical protein R3314_01720 [Longimicrobiales bacterium]|nr:hypothetical protein [Longimicrobiales bacterium]
MRRIFATLAALAVLAAAPGLHAQDTGDHSMADQQGMATSQGMPDGWMMRFDRSGAGADMVDFRVMEPGWHVNTGRAGAAVFWQPGMEASGSYRFGTTLHLFDPASHAEAFGLFVGGEDLDGAGQEYLYFLVRQTGEYLIKRRMGSETENVVGWTAHDAVPTMEPGAAESTAYPIAIEVDGDRVHFLVDGTAIHTLPADQLDTDGQVGVRINHMLNMHIEPLQLGSGM